MTLAPTEAAKVDSHKRDEGNEMPEKKTAQREYGRYTAVCLASGAGLGLTTGVLSGGWAIPIGLTVGSGIGVAIGAALDTQHERRAH